MDTWYETSVDVEVFDGAILTLEDGVELRFDGEVGLTLGDGEAGTLIVDGHTEGVTLTSAQDSPAAGDWVGLALKSQFDEADLTGLTVSYAGGGSNEGGVYLSANSRQPTTFTDCAFDHNAGHGVYVRYGDVSATGTSFSDNENTGLYMETNSYQTILDTFSDNVLTGNGDWPMRFQGRDVERLDDSSTFAGNGVDLIALEGAWIYQDTTWEPMDVPYGVYEDIEIYYSGTIPTLTLADGVEAQFDAGVKIDVGYSLYEGNLTLDGDWDSGEGVLLTAIDSSSNWGGLDLGGEVHGLTGFTLEHAWMTGGGDELVLHDCLVTGAEDEAINVTGGSLDISDCSVTDVDDLAIRLTDEDIEIVQWSNVDLTGNRSYPLEVYASHYLDIVDPDSDYSGNDYDAVRMYGGVITESQTWEDPGVPVYFVFSVEVGDSTNSPVLTLEIDEMWFYNSGLTIGDDAPGDLVADGLEFLNATSSSTSWGSLKFGPYTSGSVVENCLIDDGGRDLGAVLCDDCTLSLDGSTISNSATYGIYYFGTAHSVSTTGTTFTANAYGDSN